MRLIGDLTSEEAASRLRETSILCLPLGSLEQHGPHLPLDTGALMSAPATEGVPEIHGGRDETSLMLALAPDLVRRDRIAALKSPPDAAAVRAAILDPGVTWPWSSGDAGIAD